MAPTAHLDPSLGAADRSELLLAEMTVEEKSRQLTCLLPMLFLTDGAFDPGKADLMIGTGIGGMAPYFTEDPARLPLVSNQIQRYLVERTRLGIPALFHTEALNGLGAPRHPSFPTAIGLASTWSPDLVETMTEVVRRQALRMGIRHVLSPVLDVALDPRWGRVHETYGEDPLLAAALGVAFVRGMQGDDLREGVIATAKHFLGFALGLGGINTAAYEWSRRFTRDVLCYPVEAAIEHAGLGSVMNSYGDVDGIPAGLSRELLTDLLRGELGFDGFVISDYMTLQGAIDRQRAAIEPGDSGRLALHAGMDLEAPYIFGFGEALAAEVHAGRASMEDLDIAVRRILRAKFELGLFDDPYVSEGPIDIDARTAEGAELAEELAQRSIVLLENDGLLPLAPDVRVAVIGPNGHEARQQFATYTHPAGREMLRFMASGGLGNLVGTEMFAAEPEGPDTAELAMDGYVRFRYGTRSLAEELTAAGYDVAVEAGCGTRERLEPEALERAVAAAAAADVVVLALGGFSAAVSQDATEGEGSDSASIDLPAPQRELAAAIAATGKPTVVVLVQGRAYVLPDAVLEASALVVAPFGGQAGNRALVRVLTGSVSPSGKMPYSIPRHGGQIPVYHHQKAGTGYRRESMGHGTQYVDMTAEPQFAFGRGLSYATFAISDLSVTPQIDTDGVAEIQVTVTNTGTRPGAEVVQAYARVNAQLVTRPAQQLAGFARVELEPQESARVTIAVAADQLAFCGIDHRVAVEPATVDVFVGTSSDDRRAEGQFVVDGDRRLVVRGARQMLPTVTIEPLPL